VYASAGTDTAGTNGSGPRRQAQRVLADAAREVRRHGSPAARFELVRARGADDVPEAISRQADRLRADLVVVGSEGRDSLTEWVVGGTALRLIYVARRPVTVVRAPRRRLSR
jgi:nucleotide-binding universal stress UspA family protein